MDTITEVDGRRIARDVVDEAGARQILGTLVDPAPKRAALWKYASSLVLGGAFGWGISLQNPYGVAIVAAVAGAALFMAFEANAECARLRQRLDAMQALVKLGKKP